MQSLHTARGARPTAHGTRPARIHAFRSPRVKAQAQTTAFPTAVLPLLEKAAYTTAVPPEEVEAALVQLERSTSTPSADALRTVPGTWRLHFSTLSSIRALQYIPVKEDLVINVPDSKISPESELGPFNFHIKGTIFSWSEKTGILEFQFNRGVTVLFQGKPVWEVNPTTKPKSYTFFYVGDNIATARSSAGGLALMRRK